MGSIKLGAVRIRVTSWVIAKVKGMVSLLSPAGPRQTQPISSPQTSFFVGGKTGIRGKWPWV